MACIVAPSRPGRDAEVVDEVVRPVANGDVPHQIDHDGDGGYAGHRTATGQRPARRNDGGSMR